MSPGPRSTSLPSGILIHPAFWPQQVWAENWGLCPFGGGGAGNSSRHNKLENNLLLLLFSLCMSIKLLTTFVFHLTQYRLGRGLSPYQVASWPQYTKFIDKTVASGSALQVATSSSCHNTIASISAVGRLLWQARLPGTRCQTFSVIRRLAKTLLGDH